MYLISALGMVATLAYLGWTRKVLPLGAFMLMPQVVLGAAFGNVHGPVFAAIACALLLAAPHPVLAGVILSLALVKPHLSLPLILLVVLFHAPRRKPLLAGLIGATAGWTLLTCITTGPSSLEGWARGLFDWSHHVALEPNLSSLVGLYVNWAPSWLRLCLEGGSVFAALGLTCWWYLRVCQRGPVSLADTAWLWIVWFLAVPFAHYPDEILLTLPFLALLGRDGARVTRVLPALALYLTFLSAVLYQTALLSLLVMAGAACLLSSHSRRSAPDRTYSEGTARTAALQGGTP
jgi:hypothetical protein